MRIPGLYDGRNKSFFHWTTHTTPATSWEGLGRYNVPTLAMQAGNFSAWPTPIIDPLTGVAFAGNILPAGRISPVAKKWVDMAWNPGGGIRYLSPGELVDPTRPWVQNVEVWQGWGGGAPGLRNKIMGDWVWKMDQNIGTAHRVSFAWRKAPAFPNWQNSPWSGGTPRSHLNAIYPTDMYTLADTHAFSPTVVNELRLAVTRAVQEYSTFWRSDLKRVSPTAAETATVGWFEKELGLQGLPANVPRDWPSGPWFYVTSSGWGGQMGMGCPYCTAGTVYRTTYQIYDNLSWKRGAHNLKFGWYSIHKAGDSQTTGWFLSSAMGFYNFDGRYTGHAFSDFLLGSPASFDLNIPRPWVASRAWELAGYALDDWTVSPRLKLQLGLRVSHNPAPYDRNWMFYNFDPERFVAVVPDERSRSYVKPMWNSAQVPVLTATEAGFPKMLLNPATVMEPRIGFAWQPTGKGTTVLRGGYGLYTANAVSMNAYMGTSAALQTGGPFMESYSRTNTAAGVPPVFGFPNPFAGMVVGAPGAITSASAFDPNWRPAMAHNASLTFERMVFGDWGFRATYNMVRSTGINWSRNLNQKPMNTTKWAPGLRPLAPLGWEGLSIGENGGNAIYQGLLFQLMHNWAGGLWFQASYQYRWDREDIPRPAWDDAVVPGGTYDSYNRRYDWGPSGVLAKHDVIANWVWEVPIGTGKKFLGDLSGRGIGGKLLNGLLGNWASSGTFTIRSGDLFTLSYMGDPGNIGAGSVRPDRIDGCDPMAGRTLKRWFNPACFSMPGNGTYGDEMRNSLASPTMWIVIFNPYKDIRIPGLGEEGRLRIGASIYNLFNHPVYGIPDGNLSGGSPGLITSLTGPRSPMGDHGSAMRNILLRAAFQW